MSKDRIQQDDERQARLLAALRKEPKGMSRGLVYSAVFKNGVKAEDLDRLIARMKRAGLLSITVENQTYTVIKAVKVIRLTSKGQATTDEPPDAPAE